MAGINTTPRVLNIGNSSMNAKFESLESKSYFIDELQLLKNETTINKEQDCNINTEGTTTLKNKRELLELENKLLKDDVTNKQKFIDTLLQHNSIISVANEARKQPHERQHYERKDTELNNRQKQEENKSSEKSNEQNGSYKEKIDHQKR